MTKGTDAEHHTKNCRRVRVLASRAKGHLLQHQHLAVLCDGTRKIQ
jgi:hypothetical protein